MMPCGRKPPKKLVKVDRASGVEVKACEKKAHVLLNVCAAVFVSQRWRVETERSKMSRLSSPFGWTGTVSTKKKSKNKKKTGLFTVQQASELEDHTKPSAGQDSTWKKLQLLKVLLRCLCRLSEGWADWVDSSGDCSLWNWSFWFWTVIKNQTNKSGSDWKGYEWVQFLIKYFGIQFLSLLLCRSLPFSP